MVGEAEAHREGTQLRTHSFQLRFMNQFRVPSHGRALPRVPMGEVRGSSEPQISVKTRVLIG